MARTKRTTKPKTETNSKSKVEEAANKLTPVKESSTKGSEYVSKKQALKAIDELKKFLERSKTEKPKSDKKDLFEDADDVPEEHDEKTNLYVKFEFKKYFSNRAVLKPKLIKLTKPYLKENKELKTCLFIRDGMVQTEADLDKIESANIPTLKKILTLKQLKTIYKTYEKRYELLDEYDVFVTDDSILSSLPNTLGKPFYHETPKSPVAVRVAFNKTPKELSIPTLLNQIEKVLNSTAYLPPVGVELTLRVGSLDSKFTAEELYSNIEDVLQQFPKESLITVGLKTTKLPILPLFYTDKLYSEEDVLENVKEDEDAEADEDDAYTKALLELADEETVASVLGKKYKKANKKRKLEDGKASATA